MSVSYTHLHVGDGLVAAPTHLPQADISLGLKIKPLGLDVGKVHEGTIHVAANNSVIHLNGVLGSNLGVHVLSLIHI